jgi:hypothetical protein
MKDKIKEELLKGCGIIDKDLYPHKIYNGFQVRNMLNKVIEETSKQKDKEFLELLNKEQKDRINPNIIRAFCLKLKEKINGNQ